MSSCMLGYHLLPRLEFSLFCMCAKGPYSGRTLLWPIPASSIGILFRALQLRQCCGEDNALLLHTRHHCVSGLRGRFSGVAAFSPVLTGKNMGGHSPAKSCIQTLKRERRQTLLLESTPSSLVPLWRGQHRSGFGWETRSDFRGETRKKCTSYIVPLSGPALNIQFKGSFVSC